jgi:hypothetical protein
VEEFMGTLGKYEEPDDNANRYEAKSRLIKLAARILMTNVSPSPYIDDHQHVPKRFPVRWWRYLCGKLIAADEERKDWAREIRQISDSLH